MLSNRCHERVELTEEFGAPVEQDLQGAGEGSSIDPVAIDFVQERQELLKLVRFIPETILHGTDVEERVVHRLLGRPIVFTVAFTVGEFDLTVILLHFPFLWYPLLLERL